MSGSRWTVLSFNSSAVNWGKICSIRQHSVVDTQKTKHVCNDRLSNSSVYPVEIPGLLYTRQWVSVNSSPKNEHLLKMYSPSHHPRYRWVCFFMEKALHHLLNNGSSEWLPMNGSLNIYPPIHFLPLIQDRDWVIPRRFHASQEI